MLFTSVWAFPAHALQPMRVADRVYAFIGDLGEVTPLNGGQVGNSGFIVTGSGVVVIDTGISYRHARAMIDAIRHITDQPVKLVVITQAVQEFVFGNAAFADLGVPMITHTKSADLMRQRCEQCLQNLGKILGTQAMEGTRLIIPQRTVDASISLEFGSHTIDLMYLGWGSTPGDLAVFDRSSGVLFAGGLVSNGRIPELRDGNFKGWLQALTGLRRLQAHVVIPGYGAVGSPAIVDATVAYLRALDEKVRALYKSGASLSDAVDGGALPSYSGWALYSTLHRQNVLHRYLQLEIEELNGSQPGE